MSGPFKKKFLRFSLNKPSSNTTSKSHIPKDALWFSEERGQTIEIDLQDYNNKARDCAKLVL